MVHIRELKGPTCSVRGLGDSGVRTRYAAAKTGDWLAACATDIVCRHGRKQDRAMRGGARGWRERRVAANAH